MSKKILLEPSLIKKIPSVKREDLATKARSFMRDLGLRILVVTDEDNRILGVVWRENVLSISSSRSNIRVGDIMDHVVLMGFLGDDVVPLLREMVERDLWYVPVASSRERPLYEGVFGLEMFLEKIVREPGLGGLIAGVPVREIMTRDPIAFSPSTPVSTVWRSMVKYRFAAFPVVDERGSVVGMISQHDLLKRTISLESESGPRRGPRISSLMSRPAYVVREDQDLIYVVREMVNRNIGRVPVVDRDNTLVGIIDRSDIIRLFLERYRGGG